MTLITISLVAETCFRCGCVFGLSADMQSHLQRSGDSFHCPNGHSQVYRETEEQKLTKQLAAERARLDQAKCEIARQIERVAQRDRSLSAARGQVTRIKNRVGNGVCPCCTRSFQNLQRHMATKHPTFKAEGAES